MKSGSNTAQPSLKLPALRVAIGKAVVLREQIPRFARPPDVREIPAVLIEIHVEDGTITAQDAAGNLYRAGRWEWTTRKADGVFWHWPDADPPEDPSDFKPTHFPGGKPPRPRAA